MVAPDEDEELAHIHETSTIAPSAADDLAEDAEVKVRASPTKEEAPETKVEVQEEKKMDAPQLGARIQVWRADEGMWRCGEVRAFNKRTGRHTISPEGGYGPHSDYEVDLLGEWWRPCPPIGSFIFVWWEDDRAWYQAEVTDCKHEKEATMHDLRYVEDGVVELLDLRYELWQPCTSETSETAAAARRPNTLGQTPAVESMDPLIEYIQSLGGLASMLDGWSCRRYTRGVAGGMKGDSYAVWEDTRGKKYYSKKQVARTLALLDEGDVPRLPPSSDDTVSKAAAAARAAAAKMAAASKAKAKVEAPAVARVPAAAVAKRPIEDAAAEADMEDGDKKESYWGETTVVTCHQKMGGTYGCILAADHEGPHQFGDSPGGRRGAKRARECPNQSRGQPYRV